MKTPAVVLSSNTSWYLYNYRRNTIRAFQDRGYQVVCVSPTDPYSEKLTQLLACRHVPLTMDNQGNNPLRDLLLFFRFLTIYTRIRPVATFHFTVKNNVYGTMAAALLRIPAINNVSGLGTAFIHPGWISRVVRGLYRISQPFAFRVFCQNPADLEMLKEHRLVPTQRLYQIPGSGVDIERFRLEPRPRPNRPFRFLYLGRMLADKGLFELVQAFNELHAHTHTELWLAGFSDAKNNSAISAGQIDLWAQDPGISWLGASDKPEELLAQVDCLVLPSYREGLPRSLLEASAMCIPAIATDVPGCRDVIKHGHNGLLCKPRDVSHLLNAMQAMASLSDAERERMGKNGRILVASKFSEHTVIENYVRALEEATV